MTLLISSISLHLCRDAQIPVFPKTGMLCCVRSTKASVTEQIRKPLVQEFPTVVLTHERIPEERTEHRVLINQLKKYKL